MDSGRYWMVKDPIIFDQESLKDYKPMMTDR
jgi:hypothetical protein